MKNQNLIKLVGGAFKSPPELNAWPVKLKFLPAILFSVMFTAFSINANAQTEILNEELRDGALPSGWSQTDITFSTAAGGYANFTSASAVLQTPVLDLSGFTNVELTFDVAKFGSGGDGPLTVEVSDDGGATWTTQSFDSPTPTSSTYLSSGPTVINSNSSTAVIRFIRTNSPSGKRLRDVILTGTEGAGGDESVILAVPTSLENLDYVQGNGPSAAQSFTVSGSDLTDNVSFTSGTDFEFSYDGANFSNSLFDLPQAGGTLPAVDVFVRLAAGLSAGTYNEILTISSPGASDVNVSLSGTVAGLPQGLIISQYIDTDAGTTPKGIELWNQTGATIDFSIDNLVVLQGTNGAALSPLLTVNSGTLADGAVMVIGTSNMGAYLANEGLGDVFFVSQGFTFNGDDALSIELGGVTEDTFGTPGVDPGSSWSGDGVSTADQNIALLCDITTGEPAGWSDPSLRFATVGGGQELTGFGVAPQQCGGSACSIDNVSFSNLSACDSQDNSYTVDITVEYTDGPGGNLVVNGEVFAMTSSPQTVQLTGDSDGQDVNVEVSFALDPACSSSNPALFTAPESCQESNELGLIISQYIDTDAGTTPKGIELWNQTGATIDFSIDNLVVLQGTNGAALSPLLTVNSGTLADGAVMVIGTSNMGAYLANEGLGDVFFVSQGFTFNGDDALSIELGGVTEDTFGTPGVDPGSAWTGGGVSTANENIALLCDITTGEPAGWSDPSLRFETVGNGSDLTGFGVPPLPCGGPTCSINNVTFSNLSACDEVDNSYTVDITVEYTDGPGGNLVVNGEIFAMTSSPQTVQITGDSDGQDVDVEVSFALDPSCTSSNPAMFTAPAPCVTPVPECGNESFSNMGTSTGSYSTISFVGENGFDITATDARADQTINGSAILVRDGSLTVFNVTGGIGDLTLTTQRKFAGGAGVLTVIVDGSAVGTIPYDATVQTTTIENINFAANSDIVITTPGNDDRIAMDDLIWTCFSAPGISLSPISGNTDESGTSATFDVTLTEEPASDVVLDVTSGDLMENTVSPATLTFDASNWDVPQTVTVTGVPDGIIDGDQTTTITVSVDDAQSDPAYHGLSATIDVINEDVDACDVPVWEVVNITTNSGSNNGGAWTPVSGGFSANGFCGGGCQENVDTWLIYGPLDLSSSTSFNLLFDASESFGTTDLTIQFSTDYESSPCPLWATWNGQSVVASPGAIDIDLSGAAGLTDVYIGIAYTDDGADGYSDWSLTNFEIVSDVCPVVGTPVVSDCTIPAPANNECADAQNLNPSTWPATNNSLGTLGGATNDGGAACTGSADGGDVYYTFIADTENHYWVNVNPFGGADVAIEVTDACGGVVEACVDNAGAGSAESAFIQNLAAGTYTVRVYSGSAAASTADGNFLINVQSFPTAKVQDNPANMLYACNTTDRQLEDIVGATPQSGQQPGILDYRWRVVRQGGGYDIEWTRGGPNYATILNWLGMDYNETYDVYVRMLIQVPGVGPVWGVYDEGCTITTSNTITTTQVRSEYTPTNAQGNAYAMCDIAVAETVADAENYRWTFSDGLNPDVEYERGVGNPSVKLSWVNCLIPNTVYNVTVQANVGGVWGPVGPVQTMDIAPTATTQLRADLCGNTFQLNNWLFPTNVCTSTSHEWELVNTVTSEVHTITTVNATGAARPAWAVPALVPGAEYSVRVKAFQCGVDNDFGPACNITIAGPTAPGNEMPMARELSETTANLFPNPNAGSEVRVELDGLGDGNHEVMIQIYDVYGKLIQTEGFGHTGSDMSRLVRFDGNLAMGMYMVQIVVDGERFSTQRLVVK